MSRERPPGQSGNSRRATSRVASWVLGLALLVLFIAFVIYLITHG
jgi:hypothetical protein